MPKESEERTGSEFDVLEEVKEGTLYRLFNPQVPVIICSKFANGIAATPVNSCSSASDSPPMVSLALQKGTRTNKMLKLSLRFSINWVNFEPKSSRDRILELAKPSVSKGMPENKLREHGIPYNIIRRVPVLENVCAFALCKVQRRIATGDHDLFIARVNYARAIHDFTGDSYWRFEDYKPVLYIGSIRKDPFITMKRNDN